MRHDIILAQVVPVLVVVSVKLQSLPPLPIAVAATARHRSVRKMKKTRRSSSDDSSELLLLLLLMLILLVLVLVLVAVLQVLLQTRLQVRQLTTAGSAGAPTAGSFQVPEGYTFSRFCCLPPPHGKRLDRAKSISHISGCEVFLFVFVQSFSPPFQRPKSNKGCEAKQMILLPRIGRSSRVTSSARPRHVRAPNRKPLVRGRGQKIRLRDV